MGRAAGAKNYKKKVLLDVVKEILPHGSYAWEQVAVAYKEKSGESELRDKDDVKRHWVERMCNKYKKPTGKSGDENDFILKCQRVQRQIHKKSEAAVMGVNSQDSKSDEDSDGNSADEEESHGKDAGYFEEEKEEEVVLGVPIPLGVVNDTAGVDYLSARGGESKEDDFEIIGDNHPSPEVSGADSEAGNIVAVASGRESYFTSQHSKKTIPEKGTTKTKSSTKSKSANGVLTTIEHLSDQMGKTSDEINFELIGDIHPSPEVNSATRGAGNAVAFAAGRDSFFTPQPSKKTIPEKGTPKTKNSTNKKRANVGLSIERLCDQIGKTSAEIMRSENRSASADVGISQMIAMQFFQSQLQDQDLRIKGIERQSKDIKNLMKKMIKRQKRTNTHKKKKRKRKSKENRKSVKKAKGKESSQDSLGKQDEIDVNDEIDHSSTNISSNSSSSSISSSSSSSMSTSNSSNSS